MNQLKLPNTISSLREELLSLGLERGMVVIVHSSLSSLGWVCGGPVAVVQAIMDIIGEEGTIVMPTQTADNSDPADWQRPPVPETWWSIIRNEMPAYHPQVTPSRGMGVIVETFRTMPGVKRSNHPMYSFAAWGKFADYIVSEQPLEAGFGLQSPLAKIYELNGYILLLGVDHDSNTSLHFAEHAVQNRKKVEKGAALLQDGKRVWKEYSEILYDSDVFEALGQDFESKYAIQSKRVGAAMCKLIQQRTIVDFASKWIAANHPNNE
ncbi:aminoglycoside N(3)-acetyltransferase [Bacillus sp. HMF5848]|nr:aminoglycoside N(3)-acetyltransferase [Bacillus sp. HMF5848]